MRILHDRPLRVQILAATLALLVPFAAVIAWSAARTRAERDAELREEAGSIAATAAANLTEYLASLDSIASALTQHPAVVALDRPACDRLFASVLHDQPLLLNIVLTDGAGMIRGTGVAVRTSIGSTAALPYVMDVIASGKPEISDLVTGVTSGKPTVIMAYPVFASDRRVVGVVGIGLDLSHLQNLFKSIPLPEGSVITLHDEKSRVLARTRDADRYIGKYTRAYPVEPRDVPRTQRLGGLDGVERFYGNAALDRGPWLLSVGIPTSVAAARLAPLWRRNMAIAGVALLTFLAVSLVFSHVLSGALDRLRLAAQRIAAGDLSPPERGGMPNLELGHLQDAFITMASNLRDAHAALDRQLEQERRMREVLQSLQHQVVRQERLAAVGVLVSGVAHELNNPLQAILGTVELLERQPDVPAAAREEVGFIKTQSGRARDIIRNLSRFSSQQSGPPALVDLRDVIAEIAQLRRRNLQDAGIALDIEASHARRVLANFTELEQVVLNFVINAQQAIESLGRQSGRIRIRAFDSGRRVRLEVEDDGPGVSAEDEPKLFQPFFTTKPVGQGTGLGLSVSYGIVEANGGTIGYARSASGGATFYFELPAADTP